jgi:hypothetical protein
VAGRDLENELKKLKRVPRFGCRDMVGPKCGEINLDIVLDQVWRESMRIAGISDESRGHEAGFSQPKGNRGSRHG